MSIPVPKVLIMGDESVQGAIKLVSRQLVLAAFEHIKNWLLKCLIVSPDGAYFGATHTIRSLYTFYKFKWGIEQGWLLPTH